MGAGCFYATQPDHISTQGRYENQQPNNFQGELIYPTQGQQAYSVQTQQAYPAQNQQTQPSHTIDPLQGARRGAMLDPSHYPNLHQSQNQPQYEQQQTQFRRYDPYGQDWRDNNRNDMTLTKQIIQGHNQYVYTDQAKQMKEKGFITKSDPIWKTIKWGYTS